MDARSVSGMVLPRMPPKVFLAGPVLSGLSSWIEFQALQASHCPDHLLWDAPHSLQVKMFCLAMFMFCPIRSTLAMGKR